jgi:hypothetical protein
MLREKQIQLQARAAQLAQRSDALRLRLSGEAQALERPLALADRAHGGIDWLKARPRWLLAVAAAPLLLRPRRALGWGLKLWWGWRLWQRIRAIGKPAG